MQAVLLLDFKWHRVENPRSGQAVARGMDSAMQQYWLSLQSC